MGRGSRAQLGRGPSLTGRLGRGLRFVAIVWSIAGAFLVLHFGLPELFSRLLMAGWMPVELALPERGALPVATHCGELHVSPAPDPAATAQARAGAWKLGQELGFAASMANLGYSRDKLAPALDSVAARAGALGVPAPQLPEIRSFAYAIVEFGEFVRADPRCVASALERRFGEAAAHQYRFGLLVGYVAPVRAKQLGVPFPAEIAHYGRLAGVPEPLWRPLTQAVLVAADGATGPDAVWNVVEGHDAYIGAGG